LFEKGCKLSKNNEFIIDLNDDNLIHGIPDDPIINNDQQEQLLKDEISTTSYKTNKTAEKSKLSKNILNKSTLNRVDDDITMKELPSTDQPSTVTSMQAKNTFWNISNDNYYISKISNNSNIVGGHNTHEHHQSTGSGKNSTSLSASLLLHHTQVALELAQPFFPTYMNARKLRHLHRFPLKNIFDSSNTEYIAVHFNSVEPHLKDLKKRTILLEYSEQYPPLLQQPGMASKIRNYFKKKSKDDSINLSKIGSDIGELVQINSSPFLGSLKPGECLQSIETNMFRAPIYKHSMPQQDFVITRYKDGRYEIREINLCFLVGQECPLMEVYGPNSKKANTFMKDLLQVNIFRLFHKSKENPKKLRMEDLRRAFPMHTESSIRKRLKIFADFKRTGKLIDNNWWVLKPDFNLPKEEDIRTILTPEQCCAYYSMLSAEQRLKDAGYGEKNLFANDDEDVDNMKIDDEVKNAPWHTTRAYIDSIKGKCLLQINGVADPTGRGN
jgi:transcription initiation factor TFIID subunit 1